MKITLVKLGYIDNLLNHPRPSLYTGLQIPDPMQLNFSLPQYIDIPPITKTKTPGKKGKLQSR